MNWERSGTKLLLVILRFCPKIRQNELRNLRKASGRITGFRTRNEPMTLTRNGFGKHSTLILFPMMHCFHLNVSVWLNSTL
jgi:hypothetical protein